MCLASPKTGHKSEHSYPVNLPVGTACTSIYMYEIEVIAMASSQYNSTIYYTFTYMYMYLWFKNMCSGCLHHLDSPFTYPVQFTRHCSLTIMLVLLMCTTYDYTYIHVQYMHA